MTHEHEKHHRHGHHGQRRPHLGPRKQDASSNTDIEDYGCWKGTPVSFTAQTIQQDDSPHIYLKFDDGSGKQVEAAINVASTTTDHDLVYWLNREWTHPVTKTLTPLADGFHKAQNQDGTGLSLDFLRTSPSLVDLSAGRVLPNNVPGQNNDILDELKPLIQDAIDASAKVYIFGSNYGTGIDDVHMNQGNDASYVNAVGEDGGLIFHYAGTNAHFEAVFLAFATQRVPTNDQTGAYTENSTPLDEIAKGEGSS